MGKVTVVLVACILFGFIHLSGACRAEAQTVNGTILGFVQDQQRGVIPGAEVSARNLETGAVRAAISDEAGAYRISSVPAGPYELTVVMPGFKTEVRSGIKVTVGITGLHHVANDEFRFRRLAMTVADCFPSPLSHADHVVRIIGASHAEAATDENIEQPAGPARQIQQV